MTSRQRVTGIELNAEYLANTLERPFYFEGCLIAEFLFWCLTVAAVSLALFMLAAAFVAEG